MCITQLRISGLLVILSLLLSLDHAFDDNTFGHSEIDTLCQHMDGRQCDGQFVTKICSRYRKVPRQSERVPGQHGDKCNQGSDCRNQDSVCYNGICLCRLGLYYSPTHHVCLSACEEYGKQMDFYKGAGLRKHNDKIIKGISMKLCLEACVSEKSFTCLTFDWKRNNKCFLSKSGYLDVAPKERELGLKFWFLAQRQCK